MRFFTLFFVCLLAVSLSACQSLSLFSSNEPEFDLDTLAAIEPAVLHVDKIPTLNLNVSKVIENYTQLLPMLQDPDAQIRVLHRLADLKLQKGELLMADQAIDELEVAVSAYQGLLVKYPMREDNDHVLYQLSKTYDLKGMREAHLATLDRIVNDFPNSEFYVEVQFRRGELLFTDEHYLKAQQAFEAVISAGDSVFLANSHYMHGWSLFKQTEYQPALVSYSKVLDLLLRENLGDEQQSDSRVDEKYQTMVQDLLRVMSLSFSYLGGADSLSSLFESTGEKYYEDLVYRNYSEFLISKEQYSDAIAVFNGFITRQPLDRWSPRFQVSLINTLKLAGFKRDIYDEKIRFIATYGLGSEYWEFHTNIDGGRGLAFTRDRLESLLIEISDLHYVKAQTAQKKKQRSLAKKEFTTSARYNRAFIETFPTHNLLAERLFLLAESDLQVKDYASAIAAFERAGYEFPEFERAAEAAYASIVSYQSYSTKWPKLSPELQQELYSAQQKSRLHFVDYHRRDSRALDVLFLAASYSFKETQYLNAIEQAQGIILWPESFESAPSADSKMLRESYLIKAHSLYELNDFAPAETSYSIALQRLTKNDKRRPGIIESLAATVYKQAEVRLTNGQIELAIEEFLRVGLIAPSSALRSSAEYDAAGYLIELKQWPRVISVLTDFRQRYPGHQLINTLPAKLALAYRETKQWSLAANELSTMRKLAKTEQEKQDILYIVAELYDKAENNKQAILKYRLYANSYPKPADVYMEATNRLAELYEQTAKPLKRRFWLAKQIKMVDQLKYKADDRMRYLAAKAASVLANDAFIQYKRIKLKLPLNVSMVKKTAALQKAMKAYQKTATYGVSQFSTEAGYRMADIYAQLSKDLMDSDRPKGLNELELEQYDILLEEQAYPFEDSAIDIHEQNASRSWNGLYDDWVKNSFDALRALLPGRYAKDELRVEATSELY
jgi:tetratricopeptide (TPR) repeat protein